MVTAAELSQAVGVQYTAITGAGTLCGVKGPGSASFNYTVEQESATNTWSEQVSTIKGDDGQALSEPGIGDKAVWGGEEFAAEAHGYIVGVIGAPAAGCADADMQRRDPGSGVALFLPPRADVAAGPRLRGIAGNLRGRPPGRGALARSGGRGLTGTLGLSHRTKPEERARCALTSGTYSSITESRRGADAARRRWQPASW
jgi:hypothetical protein